MIRLLSTAALLALLAACGDGQPFEFEIPAEDGSGGGDGGSGDGGADGDGATDGFGSDERLLPGTADPAPDRSILRFEPEDEDGGGSVRRVALRGGRLEVDNLAFDGTEPYDPARDGPARLNGYAVFQNDLTVDDSATGSDIAQLDYRAIYGDSRTTVRLNGASLPATRFAVVRTGDFSPLGFGGFLYERNGGVEIPETGQAAFRGDYAGMRIFENSGGMELTTGDIAVFVDFADFNTSDGVWGMIENRRAFNPDTGRDVEINTTGTRRTDLSGRAILDLPDVELVLSDGASTPNGEIVGTVVSSVIVDGEIETYESGTYQGILAGDLATGGEVVGVIVMTSEDPRFEGINAQETGGFVAYRD